MNNRRKKKAAKMAFIHKCLYDGYSNHMAHRLIRLVKEKKVITFKIPGGPTLYVKDTPIHVSYPWEKMQ